MKKHVRLLIILIVISAVLVGGIGAYLKYAVLKPLDLCQDQSIFAVPFILLTDHETRYTLQNAAVDEVSPSTGVPETDPPQTQPPQTEPSVTETQATEPVTEPPTEPEVIELDESWFDDALFIGDSRTLGLQNYGNLGEADFFCDVGISVYGIQNVRYYVEGVGRLSLSKLLEKKTYGKIYINLGLNEIMGVHEKLLKSYQELIDMIHEKQPDTCIILQGIMTVGRNKSNSAACFSLENIHGLNEKIAAMATGDNMRYIDVNEWAADEEGYLPDDWTRDGTHLYATGYEEWSQWLLDNAETLGIE